MWKFMAVYEMCWEPALGNPCILQREYCRATASCNGTSLAGGLLQRAKFWKEANLEGECDLTPRESCENVD